MAAGLARLRAVAVSLRGRLARLFAMRALRLAALSMGVLLAMGAAGVAVFLATLDIERFRSRIQAAAMAALGRQVDFGGMALHVGLTPRITISNARLANLHGGSRPDMVNVARAELEVALLPMLSGRIALRRLLLVSPDILLEEVAGEPNWRFSPARAAVSAPGPAAPQPRRAATLDIGLVQLRDARLVFPGAPPGGVTVARLDANANGNLSANGALQWGALPITFDAEGGPLGRLMGEPGGPWPLRLRAEAGGARLQLRGEVAEPRGLLGYRMELSADVPALAVLAPLAGRDLPALTGLVLRGRIEGDGYGMPRPRALQLSLGAAPIAAGWALEGAEVSLPALDQPAQLSLRGRHGGEAFSLSGRVGPFLGGALAVDLTGEHLGLTLSTRGQVERPLDGTGVAIAISLRGEALGHAHAELAERGAFFAEGLGLTGIVLEGPIASGTGNLVLTRAPLPRLDGALALQRLDLDAMRALPLLAPPAPAPASSGAATNAARGDGRVIPPLPLSFAALGRAGADLRVEIGALRHGGRDYQQFVARLLLADARARLDPLAFTMPGGRFNLRVAADGAAAQPQMQVSARADALDMAPFLRAMGNDLPLTGRGEIDIDLRGQGADLRAWAASAVGYAGMALTDGRIAGNLVQGALRSQGALGEVAIACLATRFDVVAGIAQSRTLFVDGSLGRATGQGQISLRDETLALRLNTDLRLPVPGTSGLRVRAPLPITGTLAAPRFEGAALLGNAVANQADRLVPGLGQALSSGGTATMSDCATALGLARGGRPGPVPASLAPPPEAPSAAPAPRPQLNDLLRGLLGR